MKVTGFTIIKNAVQFDFPIREAIQSILPVCDDMVVAVGDCNDGTRELIASIAPAKIRIIDTVWNKQLNVGGAVLADETNKALRAVAPDTDWCFYIQGDEVLHEKYHDTVYKAMERWNDDKKVDGLLFKYLHFYGSYDYTGASSDWYRREIRIVRNDPGIYSYRDAQGFRKGKDEKLGVKEIDAYIYHYGWVREPKKMNQKLLNTGSYWGGENFDKSQYAASYSGDFDYSNINMLKKFNGTHPAVMQERIRRMNWKFDHDLRYNNQPLKDRFKDLLERLTGKRFFDYKNYRIVK
ncbi:MAG TPA: glycosyltransferase family 2 protein [Chitinophagaceae bacterium]